MKKNLNIYAAILLPCILWLPSVLNFFSSDDWFHLRISQIESFRQFFNFFSFFPNPQSASFYRPLPTQIFFFVFQILFGLNAWPYHVFVLLCFGYSIYLVYKFSLTLLKTENGSILVALIYGISTSNFTRIYFLSAFQEILLVIFSLLCLINFKKSLTKSLIFFIFALLSKETAVVIPLLLLVLNFGNMKKSLTKFLTFLIILLPYLYFRFVVFGLAVGDSYLWNFSPLKAINTLMWYILWSFGGPELLVDYIGSWLIPIARFYTDLPVWWPYIVFPLMALLVTTFILFIKKIGSINKIYIYTLLFLIPLLPVIFLPQHKFPLELGLPMVGFSLCIVYLLPASKIFRNVFLALFISYNIAMMVLTYPRHYSVGRAIISQKVYLFFNRYYKDYPRGKYFEFVNDGLPYSGIFGQSRQISQALSGSDFFKDFYHNPGIKVYYEDTQEEKPGIFTPIKLQSSQFIDI